MEFALFIIHFVLLSVFSLQTTASESQAHHKDVYASLDLNFPTLLPKNFRMPTDPFKEQAPRLPSREGLDKLRASSSGQFLPVGLVLMMNKLPQDKTVIIVDLREESHGYVNSMPIFWRLPKSTWTNVGKSKEEIEQDEKQRLKKLQLEASVVLDSNTLPLKLHVASAVTEKELLDQLNIKAEYLRIPITENHAPPPPVVDYLVHLMHTLPENKWFHVHCHGGRGRTTTFLVMYDILMNGRQVSLEDILLRQKLLGGTDILKPLDTTDFRHVPLDERVHFIRKFYTYVTTSDVSKVKYSEWLKAQK